MEDLWIVDMMMRLSQSYNTPKPETRRSVRTMNLTIDVAFISGNDM